MVKVKPTASQGRITVRSNNDTTIFGIKDNLSEYYAKLSERWANSPDMVNGIDYSSKHYAEQSKASAKIANEAKIITQELIEGFGNNVQEKSDEVLVDIESLRSEAINSINSTKTTILRDIEFVADGEKEEIRDLADEIKDNVDIVNTAINDGVERLNSIDALKQSQITNCILETPQNIKLELVDNVLTLKAGSKVIVPNGVGVFEELTISNDLTLGKIGTATTSSKLYVKANGSGVVQWVNEASGATVPTNNIPFAFYNTSDNTCKLYNADGTVAQTVSFPIAIIHRTTGSWDKIEQVFNGFGYIGSHLWVDKGVKGLIPNGFNSDGTLNNIEFTTSKVITFERNLTGNNIPVLLRNNHTLGITTGLPYDEENNIIGTGGYFQVGNVDMNAGAISNLQVRQPVKLVQYDELEELKQKQYDEFEELKQNTLNKQQTTNCLIEVPQNIKLELKDGVLTLKAGSKVIVPNGVGVFDVVSVTKDITVSGASTSSGAIRNLYYINGALGVYVSASSGTTAPSSGTNQVFYNTSDNTVKVYTNGSIVKSGLSLPIARIKDDGTYLYGSINQVFNGFGYIDKTIWVDKGVKGLIPDGRNEDGSLKNIEFTTSVLKTRTDATAINAKNICIYKNMSIGIGNGFASCKSYADRQTSLSYQLVEDINQTYVLNRTYVEPLCILGDITCDGTKVVSLKPKQPFRAVDYNEAVIKSDLSEAQVVIETYVNGTSWYRVWSADSTGKRWCEQGGKSSNVGVGGTVTVTLLKTFSNTNYTVLCNWVLDGAGSIDDDPIPHAKTTSNFKIYGSHHGANDGYSAPTHWYACGYIS